MTVITSGSHTSARHGQNKGMGGIQLLQCRVGQLPGGQKDLLTAFLLLTVTHEVVGNRIKGTCNGGQLPRKKLKFQMSN